MAKNKGILEFFARSVSGSVKSVAKANIVKSERQRARKGKNLLI